MIQSVQEQELILTSNTAPITFADTDFRDGDYDELLEDSSAHISQLIR